MPMSDAEADALRAVDEMNYQLERCVWALMGDEEWDDDFREAVLDGKLSLIKEAKRQVERARNGYAELRRLEPHLQPLDGVAIETFPYCLDAQRDTIRRAYKRKDYPYTQDTERKVQDYAQLLVRYIFRDNRRIRVESD